MGGGRGGRGGGRGRRGRGGGGGGGGAWLFILILLVIIGFLVWYFMLRDDDTATPDPTETTELLLPFLALGPRGMLEVSKIRRRN